MVPLKYASWQIYCHPNMFRPCRVLPWQHQCTLSTEQQPAPGDLRRLEAIVQKKKEQRSLPIVTVCPRTFTIHGAVTRCKMDAQILGAIDWQRFDWSGGWPRVLTIWQRWSRVLALCEPAPMPLAMSNNIAFGIQQNSEGCQCLVEVISQPIM